MQSPVTDVQKEFMPSASAQTASRPFDNGLDREERGYEQASHKCDASDRI